MGLSQKLADNIEDNQSSHGPVGQYLRGKLAGALGGGSKSTNYDDDPTAGSYKKGGMVKKTGLARVHKGERVLTKGQQKRMSKKR